MNITVLMALQNDINSTLRNVRYRKLIARRECTIIPLKNTPKTIHMKLCIHRKSFSFWEYFSEDRKANRKNSKGLFLVFHFRLANWIRFSNSLVKFLGIPYLVWYKFFVEWVLGFELPCSTVVGKGLMIHHGIGTVVNSNAIIGDNCCLLHQVTIGSIAGGDNPETPVIGDGVKIGVGAKILGGIKIGNGARVGADTLVLKDVPEGNVVVGNPMRTLR